MSKKLGLDAAYKGLNLTTSVNKNSVLNKINLSGSTGMKAYDSTKMLTNSIALGIKQPSKLTFGKKALSIGKKVLGKTPVGKAVGLAIAAGTGANIGYEYGKDKFKSFKEDIKKVTGYKTDKKNKSSSNESYEEGRKEGSKKFEQLKEKVSNTAGQFTGFLTGKRYGGAMKKMSGGMMQGYGAARTSGMGLEDESLMPGTIYKASEGIMLSAYKRPTMSIQEGAAKARERNKKQDERKKEIDKAAKKYRVGGGGADRYGPHKVDVNRQATEALLGTGPIQEKIIKFADKFNKKQKDKK
jgi:uncharacterized protein (DUF697 family)